MNGYGTNTAYRDTEVLSSSAERLVPMLYERLVLHLKRGAVHIRRHDIEGKFESLTRAQDILAELMSSLDFEAGGEIAPRLASLYGFWMKEILAASKSLDAGRLEDVTTMVAALHEAWEEAARSNEGGSAPLGAEAGV